MDLKLNLDEYENIIVYKSLTDEKYLATIISHLNPEYFKNKNIKHIFEIIKAFYLKRNTIPTISELKTYINSDETKEAFKTVLRTFSNIDKNLDNTELIENTERYLKERAIYNTMLDVAEDVGSGKIDTGFILDAFEKSCNIQLKTDVGLNLFKNFKTVVEDLSMAQPVISTGYKWLDEKLDGGFLMRGRAVYIFAGETNVGKSIVLGNIATNIVKQNKNVLLVTLEMSELIYARRLSSNLTKIPMRDLKSETMTLEQQIGEISNEHPDNTILIKEFPPSTITPHQLKAFIKGIATSGLKIDAIVLDYINLIKASQGNNSYERIKDVAEQIRALSYIFNCPVITATQLNRSGYDVNNPGLETISESIGLAATADVIISVFQDDEDRELGVLKFGFMKNRFGANFGTTAMKIDYSTLTISEDDTLNQDGLLDEASKTLSLLSNKS